MEAVLALMLAWVLVFAVPWRLSAALFGGMGPALAPPDGATVAARERVRSVMRRLQEVAARLPWRSTCLVMAVAGRILLARRGIRGAVVRFGVRRDRGKGLEAHAWLLLGAEVLLGAAEAPGFQPLADLGR